MTSYTQQHESLSDNPVVNNVIPDLSRSAHRLPNGSLFESSTKSSGPNFKQDSLWESAGIQAFDSLIYLDSGFRRNDDI